MTFRAITSELSFKKLRELYTNQMAAKAIGMTDSKLAPKVIIGKALKGIRTELYKTHWSAVKWPAFSDLGNIFIPAFS